MKPTCARHPIIERFEFHLSNFRFANKVSEIHVL
jgi:hypothetical protein